MTIKTFLEKLSTISHNYRWSISYGDIRGKAKNHNQGKSYCPITAVNRSLRFGDIPAINYDENKLGLTTEDADKIADAADDTFHEDNKTQVKRLRAKLKRAVGLK